jgi:hypothetical protein
VKENAPRQKSQSRSDSIGTEKALAGANCLDAALLVAPKSALTLRPREHDIGADREPEGVVADDRDLDKDAEDRKDDREQREHKSKVHCAISSRCNETAKGLLM